MSGKQIDDAAVDALYEEIFRTGKHLRDPVPFDPKAIIRKHLTAAQQESRPACAGNMGGQRPVTPDMARDAERYRFLRGDHGPTSVRWPRWKIEHWTGFWNPAHGSELDAAIDAAMREASP